MRSPVFRTAAELEASVREDRLNVAEACGEIGAVLAAAGSHPFASWDEQVVVDSEHYRWIVNEHAYVARRLLSFGMHIHVGMHSAESALYAINEFRRWAYPLMGLSANSPFFEGQRTGLASTRAHLFGAMPRTGLPPAFRTFPELESHYNALLEAGDVMAPGDLWWALRPQPPLGTAEVRVFDLPTDVRRVGAFAAVTQASLAFYQDRYEEGVPPTDLKEHCLRENRWKATRFGIEADILDAATGSVVSTREQLGRLFALVLPKAEELGCASEVERARALLGAGTEADWQLRTVSRHCGDLRALEKAIANRTVD
jgi:carboxylate-amine ligase